MSNVTIYTLAKELNMARMTFSRYLHSLINSGFIQPRGNLINRYTITDLGIKVVKTINRLWFINHNSQGNHILMYKYIITN